MEDTAIDQRKEKVTSFLKTYFVNNRKWLIYFALIFIVIFTSVIRTSNIPTFQGKYLPDVDSYLFYRYVAEIHDQGSLPEIDTLRNYPLGFKTSNEFVLPSYIIVGMDKLITIFRPSQTIFDTTAIYPVVFFALGLIVFFFLVRRLFNSNVAILATAFLSVMPTYLYRTMAGVADKEPLGMFFMFLSLLFFVKAMQSDAMKKALFNGALAGIFTGLMGLSWAGVAFITLLIPIFVFIEFMLNKINKKEIYVFALWTLIYLFMFAFFTSKYRTQNLFTYFGYMISLVVLAIIYIDHLIFEKKLWKLDEKLARFNRRMSSIVITALIILVLLLVVFGPSFVATQAKSVMEDFILHPGGTTRFQLTVSENQQPYLGTWLGNFGKIFFWLFFIGSVVMFFDMVKGMKKYRWIFTAAFAMFITGFVFSRYSGSSVLNGTSFIAKLFLVVPLLVMIYIFLHAYLKTSKHDSETFSEFSKFDSSHILVLLLFALMVLGARSAIRLLFTLSVPAAITGSFLILYLPKLSKNKELKITSYVVIALLLYFTLFSFLTQAKAFAPGVGPSFSPQWQTAMRWVQESTPKDAVFAHWWDYGYWIQMMGKRATVTDGGNAIGYWNHLLGRHLLTAQSENEALEFLKSHNTSYFLVVSEEIGKYSAFSSIGGDENNDRYSSIGNFILDPSQTQETRNQTIFFFRGNFGLDEDLVYQDTILPAGQAGIGGFLLPVSTDNATNTIQFSQPAAIIVYKGQQYQLPLECVYYDPTLDGIDNGKEVDFPIKGLGGCLRIIPSINPNEKGLAVDTMGGALYLSAKVARTMFSQLYLLGKQTKNFELAYDDSENVPLSYYQGRLIGPIRIWKVNYPPDIKPNPEYLKTSYPRDDLYLID